MQSTEEASKYGGGSAMKTAALELTRKRIPNRNMILQGIMKITPRGTVANEQVTVGTSTVAHNTKSLRLLFTLGVIFHYAINWKFTCGTASSFLYQPLIIPPY